MVLVEKLLVGDQERHIIICLGFGYAKSGAGSSGTSYSGGTGGGATSSRERGTVTAGNGEGMGATGGIGRSANENPTYSEYVASGGAGNPGGKGAANRVQSDNVNYKGKDGTGGLLIVMSNNCYNSGRIYSQGSPGGTGGRVGGSSGGGTINIFYKKEYSSYGEFNANGGRYGNIGAGGNGSVTIGSIATGTFAKDESNIQNE